MHIKIPRERIGVLVGLNGKIKKIIEHKLNVKIEVNSKSGDVKLTLALDEPDPSKLFRARDIIVAIGRGFSPTKAFKLFDEETSFRALNLQDYLGKSQTSISRVKGRIIGKKGKTRKNIEEFTGAHISVYGNTVSIIGEWEPLKVATDAVELLIQGSLHKNVYRFLEWKRSNLKKREMELWKISASELINEEA